MLDFQFIPSYPSLGGSSAFTTCFSPTPVPDHSSQTLDPTVRPTLHVLIPPCCSSLLLTSGLPGRTSSQRLEHRGQRHAANSARGHHHLGCMPALILLQKRLQKLLQISGALGDPLTWAMQSMRCSFCDQRHLRGLLANAHFQSAACKVTVSTGG